MVEDATKDERFSDNPLVVGDPHIRFYAGYPVHAPDGQKIGSLCVIDRKPRKLAPSQLEDLMDLAAMVDVEIKSKQMAVAQMRMNEELAAVKKAVLVDPLTRLWNRAGGEEFLTRQHQIAAQKGEKFCIAMMDIDFFKKINDTYGHSAGDEVLREGRAADPARHSRAGLCLPHGRRGVPAGHCRSSDDRRPGGREEGAETIRGTPIDAEGHSIKVTASMGLAYFDPAALVPCEEVIRLADAGLYRAKETGRDRIVSHIESCG